MSPTGRTAAIVLAAGRSSRMGSNKPTLLLGSTSVLERVVGAAIRAGVDEVVVVTGHEREKLEAVLGGLGARPVHNAHYDTGMFSSVLAGVEALPQDLRAFFILPADYPLVGARVLSSLLAAFGEGTPGIVHPTCCGRRGHPPLFAGRYRQALLQSAATDDLQSFVQRHAADSREVEVDDLSILMDMDTQDDYHRLCRFATLLEQDACPGPSLSRDDALYLLALLQTPDQVLRHCLTVSAVGEALAGALKPVVPALDVDLVGVAGLLHDMARTSKHHAVAAENVLRNLGLHRLAEVVGAHMVLPDSLLRSPQLTEEHLVYLADKSVVDDRVVGLDERQERALRRLTGDRATPQALEGLRARMDAARAIRDKVEALLGVPVDQVLAQAGL